MPADGPCGEPEREAAGAEVLLQRILDRLPAMVGCWDAELRNRAANAAYREWFGLTPEQMRGMHARDVLGPALFEANLPYVERVLAGEEQTFERTLLDAAGQTRHTQASYMPDRDESGAIRGFFVLVTDISERVRAEADERRSTELYRSLVRSIPGGFSLLFDESLRFRVADGEALAVFGHTPEGLEGRTPHEAFPPALADELEPRYRAALAGEATSWDRVLGDAIYHLTAGPVRDGDGHVFAGTVVCTDVTAERRSAAVEGALHAIAAMIASNASVQDVAALVAERLHEVFGLDYVSVVRIQGGRAPTVLAMCPPEPDLQAGIEMRPGDGSAVGAVALTGRPSLVRFAESPRSTARVLFANGLRAAAAAPVNVAGEVWGAIAVASRLESSVDGALLGRLASFAELVEIAIGNAQAWEELSRRATHDGVTGLPNHRSFHEHLGRELARARRRGLPLSVMMLDLDRFKLINDRFGHPAGDRTLAEVARRLSAARRSEELVARIGGEEFAVLMPDTDDRQAVIAAERLRARIAGRPFPDVGAVTVSIGVCSLDDAEGANQLMERADLALYEAKHRGRNRCVNFADLRPGAWSSPAA